MGIRLWIVTNQTEYLLQETTQWEFGRRQEKSKRMIDAGIEPAIS